jgi:hypothetical protein
VIFTETALRGALILDIDRHQNSRRRNMKLALVLGFGLEVAATPYSDDATRPGLLEGLPTTAAV